MMKLLYDTAFIQIYIKASLHNCSIKFKLFLSFAGFSSTGGGERVEGSGFGKL